ncbi:MAG: HD domain-containing protein [Candidatus Hodarchaeota archaeon]
MKDFSNYWNAITYAFEKYNNLKRDNDLPYIIHPIRVTLILRAYGFNEFDNEDLMIATLLHDLLEDTNLTINEIENRFGKRVASIVAESTKPKDLNKDLWLENFKNYSKEAKIIKIADRIDNLLDMEKWDEKRQISYLNQSKIIVTSCGDANRELTNKLDGIIQDLLSKKLHH